MTADVPARRSNGLQAPGYAPLADLDPRVADALLAALSGEGIAAYVAPSPAGASTNFDVRLPRQPTDRLWVDAARVPAAREILARELPTSGSDATAAEPTEDDQWREIVAALSAPSGPGERSWPSVEDVQSVPFRTWSPPEDPADEHYIPPEPPPLPRLSPMTAIATTCLLGGICLLLVPALLGHPITGDLATLAVLAFVAGFGTLVYRMRDRHRDEDDDPDGGAVV